MTPTPRFPSAEVASALGGPVTLLGAGATADTWKHGNSAVKIICDGAYPDDRFEREVTGLNRVSSPNVVKLIEVGEINLSGGPHAFLRFEFIEGGDVTEHISSQRWPAQSEGVSFLEGLLNGALSLHTAKVIHRDIKPANIALRDGKWESPVLLDLGLAKILDQGTITFYPSHMGTFMYMAPEQLRGKRATRASDLFAIGVTVRECIGRKHPFFHGGMLHSLEESIQRIEAGPIARDCCRFG